MAVELTEGRNNVSKAVSDLAKFFRFNVNNGDYLITIKDEIERTRYYINILKLRYGDMFEVEWDIDEEIMSYQIVKICLQPIIENAVYHMCTIGIFAESSRTCGNRQRKNVVNVRVCA